MLSLAGLMLMGFCFAPVFASLISLTPGRVGSDHAQNAIGFQVASAGLGAAVLTGWIGILADAAGLEIIGMALVICVLLLLISYETLMYLGRRATATA